MTRVLKALILGASLLIATAPSAWAQSVPDARSGFQIAPPSLNLSAQGEVKIAPDQATISFGVVTEAATAAAAMAQNASRMSQVVAALRRADIPERAIQTSGLNLSAQYDYQENMPPKLRGYEVSNRVTVTIDDLTRVGSTADAVVAAGVNQIDGIGFGLKDATAAEDEARRRAVLALQSKAGLYASVLGVELGGIRSLTESGGYSPQPPMPMYRMQVRETSMDSSTPVSGGELTVRIDITGVYDLIR